MPYVVIEDFGGGVDDRKSPITAPPGTLRFGNDVHLTPGGELEKRKAFVPLWAQEPGSRAIGLGGGLGGKLYIYGDGPRPPSLWSDFEWVDVSVQGRTALAVRRSQWWTDEPLVLVQYTGGETRYWRGVAEVDVTSAAVWSLTLPPRQMRDIVTFLEKVYFVQDTFVGFSGVAEPAKFGTDDAVGSGFFDASTQGPMFFDLSAAGIYQNRLLAFSRKGLLVYGVDPDPALNSLLQAIPNFGCIAPKSIVNLGELDVLFLSYSGVRSVRARDSSNIATVADIGSPINTTLSRHLNLLLDAEKLAPACAVYEPRDGRYMLALGDVIYVFSYFPGAKASGWTTYTPGFDVVDMVAVDNDTFVLGDEFLYSYGRYEVQDRGIGALAASDYDTTEPVVELPFADAGAPATRKDWCGLDIGAEGVWRIEAASNLRQQEHFETLATIEGSSYDRPACEMSMSSTHLKLRMIGVGAGPAAVRNVTLHYTSKGAR